MDNFAIADNFSLLARLIDIHGDNSFKAKTYASAAFAIEKLPAQLASMPADKVAGIKGIGASTAKKIAEQLQTGRLHELDEYILKTPVGILEMLKIKGIGPKKINTIWKQLDIETIGELLYACNENRLTLYKGFGEKTQKNIKDAIEFYMNNQGNYLFAQIETFATALTAQMEKDLTHTFLLTGDIRRQAEVIYRLEWVTTADANTLTNYLHGIDHTTEQQDGYLLAKGPENVAMHFYFANPQNLFAQWFATTGAPAFMEQWNQLFPGTLQQQYATEAAIFEQCGIYPIPACQRETAAVIEKATTAPLPALITADTIKGIIHCHSNWSDGSNTIEEMANAAINMGMEYLVISDHSKSAFYANGLFANRVIEQHRYIDELNSRLAPFKIFKSIESDILNDGSLDYDDETLALFDLVIASIHSNLKMPQEKAMARLMTAIKNPYTTILGHMTGRLLLSRNGYPVDHLAIIDACAAHNVVIELNAHPRRLDVDWRWIEAATAKNVLISINPDAHATDGFNDVQYGVLAAQKGGLAPQQNLSSYSLPAFEAFLQQQRSKRSV